MKPRARYIKDKKPSIDIKEHCKTLAEKHETSIKEVYSVYRSLTGALEKHINNNVDDVFKVDRLGKFTPNIKFRNIMKYKKKEGNE